MTTDSLEVIHALVHLSLIITHRLRQLRWSCLEARLLWGSVLGISSRCPTLWSWWCHRHPCRTVRTPPWIPRSVPLLVDPPRKQRINLKTFTSKSNFEKQEIKFIAKTGHWGVIKYFTTSFEIRGINFSQMRVLRGTYRHDDHCLRATLIEEHKVGPARCALSASDKIHQIMCNYCRPTVASHCGLCAGWYRIPQYTYRLST